MVISRCPTRCWSMSCIIPTEDWSKEAFHYNAYNNNLCILFIYINSSSGLLFIMWGHCMLCMYLYNNDILGQPPHLATASAAYEHTHIYIHLHTNVYTHAHTHAHTHTHKDIIIKIQTHTQLQTNAYCVYMCKVVYVL